MLFYFISFYNLDQNLFLVLVVIVLNRLMTTSIENGLNMNKYILVIIVSLWICSYIRGLFGKILK